MTDVLSAIEALYGEPDPQRQAEANQFLFAFAESEQSWPICIEFLLGQQFGMSLPPTTLFFAANLLHSKVSKEWHKLPLETQRQVLGGLEQIVHASAAAVVAANGHGHSHDNGRTCSSGSHGFQTVLLGKLCSLLASAIVNSPPNQCHQYLDKLFLDASVTIALSKQEMDGEVKLSETSMRAMIVFVYFANAFCLETQQAEIAFQTRDALDVHIQEVTSRVFQVVDFVVSSNPSDSKVAFCVCFLENDAWNCLKTWRKQTNLSLSQMFVQFGELMELLFEKIHQKASQLVVCADILSELFESSASRANEMSLEVIDTTARALVRMGHVYRSAVEAQEEDICHAITCCVSSFGETFIDWFLEPSQEANDLSEMILILMRHAATRQIASLTIDFWLYVQEEPVASRPEYFQKPTFLVLLDALLVQSAIFDPEDEEMVACVHTFREDVSDLLGSVHSLLKEQYVEHLMLILQGQHQIDELAQGSQEMLLEVCVFALTTVMRGTHGLLKQLMLPARDGTVSSQANCIQLLLHQMLDIERIFRGGSQETCSPLLINAISALLGQLATWLNQQEQNNTNSNNMLLQLVFAYLKEALFVHQPFGFRNASPKSLLQVCTGCAKTLAHVPAATTLSIVESFVDHPGYSNLEIEDRLYVIEAFTRVATLSSSCSLVIQKLMSIHVTRLNYFLDACTASESSENGASSNESAHITVNKESINSLLAMELQTLAKAMRFLDAPSDAAGGKQLTWQVIESLWPHLQRVVPICGTKEQVMKSFFELVSWLVQTGGQDFVFSHEQFLPSVADWIVQVYQHCAFVPPLECASVLMDCFGREDLQQHLALQQNRGHMIEIFRQLVQILCQTTFNLFATRSPSEIPEVVRGFFDLMYHVLLFCPSALCGIGSELVTILIECAMACMVHSHRESTRSVLVFLSYLLHGKSQQQQQQQQQQQLEWQPCQQLDASLGSLTAKLICQSLFALAKASPSVLLAPVSDVVFALFMASCGGADGGSAFHEQVWLVLQSEQEAQQLGFNQVVLGDREIVLKKWIQCAQRFQAAVDSSQSEQKRQSKQQFRSVCKDFAQIARQEITRDVLQSYVV